MPDVCRTIAWQREWKTFRHNIVANSSVNGEPIIVGPFKDLVPNVRNALDTAKFAESVSLRMYTVRIHPSSYTKSAKKHSNRNRANRHDVACPHQISI